MSRFLGTITLMIAGAGTPLLGDQCKIYTEPVINKPCTCNEIEEPLEKLECFRSSLEEFEGSRDLICSQEELVASCDLLDFFVQASIDCGAKQTAIERLSCFETRLSYDEIKFNAVLFYGRNWALTEVGRRALQQAIDEALTQRE